MTGALSEAWDDGVSGLERYGLRLDAPGQAWQARTPCFTVLAGLASDAAGQRLELSQVWPASGPSVTVLQVDTSLLAIAGLGLFTAGFWLGRWTADRYWIGKASSVTRACARGKLYRVTEEP